ncbi:EF1D factor, partial [Alaudala cheleensis]|nr:EF1D factor [Alaudala cheleensis]
MRTRKNPCSTDKAWLEKHRSDEAEREAPEREAPEPEAINGICHEDSIEGEFKGDLKKARNGKKQRKRKRSPKPKAADSKLEAILAGMSAERVWFDKPLYDRAESAYRKKLADSQSWESPETGKTAQESAVARSKPGQDIPKARMLPACSHGNLAACHHVVQGVWINKLDFDKAERAFMEKSQFSLPPNVLAIPSTWANPRLGTPDEGYGTALPTPATPGLAPGIPNSPAASVPSPPSSDQQTVNGKPQISNWEVLASEVWLEKPLYDDAEKNFYEKMLDGHPADKSRQRGCPESSESHNLGKQTGIAAANPQLPDIPEENPTCFFLHKDSESVWLNKVTYDRAESRYFALEAARAAEKTGIQESAAGNPSRPAAPSVPETKKMAVDYFLHDKVWFEKYKYDDAERRFYEQMNGPMGGPSRQQENGASTILRDIARARENIQKSLAGSASTSSPGPAGDQNELLSRISHLEVENQNLRSVVADLQMAIFKLESRLNALEKSSTSHQPSAVPPTQKVEPFSVPSKKVELPAKKAEPAAAEEDEDDDIDLFGSDDEEEDQEAAKVREERLRQYAEKKAKKPGLIAKSSILLDVKPWDDETDMAKMEECVRSIHMDGLVWGASKLVPVGYGIKKLQIQCVVEDEKVGTDILEEEITKFEDYVSLGMGCGKGL